MKPPGTLQKHPGQDLTCRSLVSADQEGLDDEAVV